MVDKDHITIRDEQGNEHEYEVEAVFEMGGQHYTMISSGQEMEIMRIEEHNGSQSLVNATEDEIEQLVAAYEIAINADENFPEQ
ncbi:DUF1292 domain-containing protein [Halalkalibacterium halodurans]|jgi:hypothetical protein|uniref:BH0507 protein n=2 Tax=Halalkalibacterium halodurans TaxID=86665 RepID=Q9KFH2_HALH5|nr:DUF1292 domain-containing protein [Halalkalibacterium halodurans]MDY7221005.1 DUF1292 domain-containing protein [Halalkalibacterium halodurans]MDY7240244.1 DUF1292 domain-containing protein [Halalkalibacterium halodurans]MED4079895.1 DUF1292 domain-containing protein [Halalkalibacterium halodurans]MED4085286.1 DUF1292 domain-containing protein [Halalkalibacterium halodurans]MED4103819.1 DUF1292 domain-containing protein [Halalkalibacterium halodurans]